jgi:hypothetical protein
MPNLTPASIRRRLKAVRRSLRALDRALADFAVALRTYKPEAPAAKADRRRSPNRTAAGRAALKLQGQYMGHMRQLRPAQKALVRAVKAKSGTKAAIRKARELVGKKAAA